jgi:hypothetical protein
MSTYISEKYVRCPYCGNIEVMNAYMHEMYKEEVKHGCQCTKCKEVFMVEEKTIIQLISPEKIK